jgi:hypothetical protein
LYKLNIIFLTLLQPVFEQLKTCDDSLYPLVAKALAGITTANKQNNDASGRHIIENISAHYPWLAPGEENAGKYIGTTIQRKKSGNPRILYCRNLTTVFRIKLVLTC